MRLGLKVPRLRAFVEAELRAPVVATAAAEELPRDAFVDRHGVAHELDPTHRDRLKPAWRTMIDPEAARRPPTDAALAARVTAAAGRVAEARRLIELAGGGPLAGRVLEVGCYDGAASFAIGKAGATVVGSDLARYYVVQRPGVPTSDAVLEQQGILAALRARAGDAAGAAGAPVAFVEDDINASSLEPSSFDAIVSFEVLEHVSDPMASFAGMARLLKPGAVAYHDYNPFFSVIGGHSLCTLDFPWGHARLDGDDFERYLRELRPAEHDQAMRFYRESLNRMTLADMQAAVDSAGLELLALHPWPDRALVPSATPDALREVRRTYPSAAIEDLLATFVSIVVRKPA